MKAGLTLCCLKQVVTPRLRPAQVSGPARSFPVGGSSRSAVALAGLISARSLAPAYIHNISDEDDLAAWEACHGL